MKICRLEVISSKLLVISLVVVSLLMQGLIPCIVRPVSAATTNNTIVYLPGMEKNLTSSEINKYYSVGSVTLQRNIKGGVEKLYYLFPDHLSSTKLVIDKDKTETSYPSYYPYGNLKTTSGTPQNITNLYTGQKQDREVNLYYYHARYYNPTIGHFISADKAESPNRYAYVANNPIMKNDPSGNREEEGSGTGEDVFTLFQRLGIFSAYLSYKYSSNLNVYKFKAQNCSGLCVQDYETVGKVLQWINPEVYRGTAFGWSNDQQGLAFEDASVYQYLDNTSGPEQLSAVFVGGSDFWKYEFRTEEQLQNFVNYFGRLPFTTQEEQDSTIKHEYYHIFLSKHPEIAARLQTYFDQYRMDLEKQFFVRSHIDKVNIDEEHKGERREIGPVLQELLLADPSKFRSYSGPLYSLMRNSGFFSDWALQSLPPAYRATRGFSEE